MKDMLLGDSCGVFEATTRNLEREARRVRRHIMRRMLICGAIEAWREVRRSKLAAITLGVWIAYALIRIFTQG